jgi:hypothetical protein
LSISAKESVFRACVFSTGKCGVEQLARSRIKTGRKKVRAQFIGVKRFSDREEIVAGWREKGPEFFASILERGMHKNGRTTLSDPAAVKSVEDDYAL